LSDFAKEKPWRPQSIILEADPPAHTRTRAVLSQVLSPTAMKGVRDHFTDMAAAKVDELLARGSFDAGLPTSRRPIRCPCFPMRWA
jgi:cytochrome P450